MSPAGQPRLRYRQYESKSVSKPSAALAQPGRSIVSSGDFGSSGERHLVDLPIARFVISHFCAGVEKCRHDRFAGGVIARDPFDSGQVFVVRPFTRQIGHRQNLLDSRGVRTTRRLTRPAPCSFADVDHVVELRFGELTPGIHRREIHAVAILVAKQKQWQRHRRPHCGQRMA